jgi:hypothetical protein
MRRHPCLQIAIWILTPLIAKGDRESLIGDLVEEYTERSRGGSSSEALRWCRRQVCASVAPLLWLRLTQARWPATLGIALLAYLSVAMVQVAVRLAIPASSPGNDLSELVVAFPAVVLIGYFAERLRNRSAIVLGVMMFLAMTAMAVLTSEDAPFWYRTAYFVVGPAAAFLGMALHRWRRSGLE